MDRIEHVHRFTRAVSVGNPREFLQAEKEDQEMAEACKRLIKNCIICWNYLYLSLKMEGIMVTERRAARLDAVARLPTIESRREEWFHAISLDLRRAFWNVPCFRSCSASRFIFFCLLD